MKQDLSTEAVEAGGCAPPILATPAEPSLEAAARQIFGVLWTAGFADFVCYEHNAAMWLEAARCATPSAPPVMAGAVAEAKDKTHQVFHAIRKYLPPIVSHIDVRADIEAALLSPSLSTPPALTGETPSQPAHKWITSTLGHGETMCSECGITNREAAAIGMHACEGDLTGGPRP